jgi:hypothetical protein
VEYFCDGHITLGNSEYEDTDCSDGSDEILEECCNGDYDIYTDEICESFY